MQATLASPWEEAWLSLPVALARLRARLYSLGAVLEECPDDQGGGLLRVRMLTQDLGQCLAREGLTRADVLWDEKAAAMHSHPATE